MLRYEASLPSSRLDRVDWVGSGVTGVFWINERSAIRFRTVIHGCRAFSERGSLTEC